MRILTALILLLFTGCAKSPHINPTLEATADRNWVPNDAVIYGADPVHGFYRFSLNQAQLETLANNAVSPQALYISPDKSQVYVDSLGPGMVELHLI